MLNSKFLFSCQEKRGLETISRYQYLSSSKSVVSAPTGTTDSLSLPLILFITTITHYYLWCQEWTAKPHAHQAISLSLIFMSDPFITS